MAPVVEVEVEHHIVLLMVLVMAVMVLLDV